MPYKIIKKPTKEKVSRNVIICALYFFYVQDGVGFGGISLPMVISSNTVGEQTARL